MHNISHFYLTCEAEARHMYCFCGVVAVNFCQVLCLACKTEAIHMYCFSGGGFVGGGGVGVNFCQVFALSPKL